MLRPLVLVVFLSSVAADKSVQFPDDASDTGSYQDLGPQARFGTGYLGYLLSFLDPSYIGHQQIAIQTPPVDTTLRPYTALTLFSAYSPVTPTMENRTTLPPVTAAMLTTDKITTKNPQGSPPLPTELPYFPTGIIASLGTYPHISVQRPTETVSSLITSGNNVCGCLPPIACANQTTRSGISIRIVTKPPTGITCPAGLIYCCSTQSGHLCGLPNIIPGVNPGPGQAKLGQHPWSAIILTDNDSYVGGGALIDPLHVLTAAHKVAGFGNEANLKIRFGDWDLSGDTEPVHYIEVKITKIVIHPNFDSVNLKNDISIITLASPVPVLTFSTPQINTICLPMANDAFSDMRCWVAGWGKDQFNGAYQQIIKEVDVPIIAHDECQKRLRGTRLGNNYVLDSKFICAGGEASKDACTGDGGNALACQRNGQFYLAGITVGGIECGLANIPGLYVNIAQFIPWIESHLKGNMGIDPRRKPPNEYIN